MFDTLTFEEAHELQWRMSDAANAAWDLIRYPLTGNDEMRDLGNECSDLSQEAYYQAEYAYRARYPHYQGEAF
jgi:hypothetical protein